MTKKIISSVIASVFALSISSASFAQAETVTIAGQTMSLASALSLGIVSLVVVAGAVEATTNEGKTIFVLPPSTTPTTTTTSTAN